jgi:hypothetical protein
LKKSLNFDDFLEWINKVMVVLRKIKIRVGHLIEFYQNFSPHLPLHFLFLENIRKIKLQKFSYEELENR